MAMTLLPRFFVMRATNHAAYLCVLENPPADRGPGFMRFGEPQVWSPRAKFVMEKSKEDDTLVHIRSCYNNKYWEVNNRAGQTWIAANATKPVEDRSSPLCTLFRASPSTIAGTPGFRLSSIARSLQVVNDTSSQGLTLSQWGNTYPIVDWETLVFLPSLVTFRSEELDGNYLCSRVLDRSYNYHRFESGLDVGDPLVAHELFPTNQGNYRIKNLHFNRFLRRANNWIWADAADNNNTNEVMFSFVRISDKVVGLRNLGNNNFCGGDTREGKVDCLRAEYPTLSRQTRLIVEERVLQREISDVRYRLSDSRIYQEEIQEVSHAFATNDSLTQETTITLAYSSTDSRTSSWTNSVSLALGVSVTFKTVLIPFISKGKVEMSTEFGYQHEWGVEETTERNREASYAVVVPPLTSKKVTLMCTKAACDVPFTYTQRDLLTNGQWVTTIKDDGIYTGINSYNFYFQSSKVVEDAQGKVYID